jgi:hypothetical protein
VAPIRDFQLQLQLFADDDAPNPFAASPRVEQKPASEAPAGRWASYAPEGIFSLHAPGQIWTPR